MGATTSKMPDDLIDFTPEMRAQAKDNIARYKTGPMFLPPVVGDPKDVSGRDQSGQRQRRHQLARRAAYDPETHIVYAQANQSAVTPISLRTPPAGFSDIRYIMGRNDTEFRVSEGPGFGSAADAPQQPVRRPRLRAAGCTRAAAPVVAALTVQGLSL